MYSNGKNSLHKKERLVKRVDAACSPSKPRDHDKDILRWPVFLPSGDQREIQINDINPTNPMYGYSSVPRAGTLYGLDVAHKRVEYMQTLVRNYVPFVKALLACERPMLWHSTLFSNDENGFNLLEFEYRNLGNLINKEISASAKKNSSVIHFIPEECFNNYNPTQLIFGVTEKNYNWIREDLNLDNGRLEGVSNYTNSYFYWLGFGSNNLYREYRFNERWSFIPYAYEYHTVHDDIKSTNEFFEYVLANSSYKEEWEMARKSAGKFNCHIFAVCNICPLKFMHLFEDYNFTNKKKWHRYLPLYEHSTVPNDVRSKNIPFFEDDLKQSFQTAVKECVMRIRKDDIGVAVRQFSKLTPRITMQDLSFQVLSSYYNVLEVCNARHLNIKNQTQVSHIPEFIEYSRGLTILSTGNKHTPPLHSEQSMDYYTILCKIDLIASSLEIRGIPVSGKLKAIFNESNLMRERFVFVVNLFDYRNGIPEPQAKIMMAKTLLTCCDHKIDLNAFEKRLLKMVTLSSSKTGIHVMIRNFQEKIKNLIESPQCDPSISIRDFAKIMLRNSRSLKRMFREVKETTTAMGHNELLFINVN